MKVYNLEHFRLNKYRQKVVSVGDQIQWFDPIFGEEHKGFVQSIYIPTHIPTPIGTPMVQPVSVSVGDLNVHPEQIWLEFGDGQRIIGTLFTKKIG